MLLLPLFDSKKRFIHLNPPINYPLFRFTLRGEHVTLPNSRLISDLVHFV